MKPGPPARGALSRLGDPRDPLGQDSLLKKFKTGTILKELREEDEDGSDVVSPEAFSRQLLAREIEDIRDSRNSRSPGKKRKLRQKFDIDAMPPQTHKVRNEETDRFGRTDQGRYERGSFQEYDRFGREGADTFAEPPRPSRDWETSRRGDHFARDRDGNFERSNDYGFGGERSDLEPHKIDSIGRTRYDEEAPREDTFNSNMRASKPGRDARDFGQMRREREAAREAAIQEARRERLREQREVSGGGDGSSDPDSLVRRVEVSRPGEEGEEEDRQKKKKRPTDPVSIPYTTAASQFLYGASTVESALKAGRRQLYKLYIYKGSNRQKRFQDENIARIASKQRIDVQYVDEDNLRMLDKMSESRPHNGYVLEASPLPHMPVRALGEVSGNSSMPGFRVSLGYQSAEEALINGASEFVETKRSSHHPFVLLLDQVLDPGNLGAIFRTACFMGVTAVATTKRGTAPVTPVVLKASAGAAEVLNLFSVDSAVDFLKESRQNGWKVYAACPPKGGKDSRESDLRHIETMDPLLEQPCVLVLGSEGEGVTTKIRGQADSVVSVPNMSGSRVVDSLNVSVAAGLMCSSFMKGANAAAASGLEDAKALF